MEPVILINDLIKHYNGTIRALDQINLEVYHGEWVAVMGASGSGKSTLLHMIAALDRPTSGSIWVDQVDLLALKEEESARFRREKIGLVFQQFYLIPYLTALENVMLAQYFHSVADEREATEALCRVGLGQRLGHYPSQLSGGEQQRVCIARALINEPGIILADEPTGNLDAENENTVMEIFHSLHKAGHTLLVATHDPQIGMEADTVVELEHGRIRPSAPAQHAALLHFHS